MAEQPGKRRGRPRKALHDAEAVAASEGAPVAGGGHGQAGESHAGPTCWTDVEARLLAIEAEHGLLGRIVVPFDQFPGVYVRPSFGCPVERGDRFTVLTCKGTWES